MHKQNQHLERVVRSLARAAIIRTNKISRKRKLQQMFKPLPMRLGVVILVGLLLVAEFTPVFELFATKKVYAFEDPQSLLPKSSQAMADKLVYDAKNQVFNFNAGYLPQAEGTLKQGGAKIIATAAADPKKGLTVSDPFSKLDFGLKPQFELKTGEKRDNRVVYPLVNNSGWLVYTFEAGQVKEDLLLRHATKDKIELKYELTLGDSLEARLEKSGEVSIYGSSLPINGQVATGSDKDVELLQKARKAAKKDTLMFTIPAPVIREPSNKDSGVKSYYELEQNILTLKTSGLKKAHYPLSIDPSVYVTSASQFMYGNNDSNIDFNTNGDFIQKGQLTGARIPSWQTNATSLNANIKAAGTVVAGGYVYIVGGNDGTNRLSSVYWGKFNPSGNTIISPTPGSVGGACTNFCTNSQYDLPNARSNLAVVTYNGYLYALGGEGADCAGANSVCSTVYVSKIGANGEPTPWVATANLETGRKNFGAVAYNNYIYVAGGQTNASANGDGSVAYVPINPSGGIGSWTITTTISFTTWGLDLIQYNGYLYVIGGAAGTFNVPYVRYIKINEDGSLASAWIYTTNLTVGRTNIGGNFVTIYGGYMYVMGGCSAVTVTACSTINSDMQLASINADGSISSWTTLSGVTQARVGNGFVAWRGALYSLGGCTASGACGTPISTVNYGVINSDGDVSNIFPSPASNSYTGTSYLSDLPALGTGTTQSGRMAGSVVINNGFLYHIGGCANNGCTTSNQYTSYAAINADGSLGAWTIATNTGLGARIANGVTVSNNTLYSVGGGTGGAYVQNAYRIGLNTDGSLNGTWTSTATVLAAAYAYPYVFSRAIPGNNTSSYLYMVGGCTGSAIGCTGYRTDVRRCTITNAGGAPASCSNTGLQLSAATGIFGGTTYGNYIYLAGGANSLTGTNVSATGATCNADPKACGGQTDLIQYAMINSSGQITRNDGTTTTGGWHIATSRLTQERRRTTAFAANGYFYVIAGHDGNAGVTLNDVLRGKIDIATGDVTNMVTLSTTITDRWDLRAAQANGYIYVIGGCTTGPPPGSCTGMTGVGEYVQIYNNSSGSPASYAYQASVTSPSDRHGASATINNGYIYVAGGCTTTTDCTTYTNNVSYAPLNADGTITDANWVTSGTLPATRAYGCMVALGNTLYYLGGQNATSGAGSAYTTVYYSTLTGGVPGAWSTASNVLPEARFSASCATYNNKIYVAGGSNATPTYRDTVYLSPSLSSGGDISSAWTTQTAFTGIRNGATAVAYGNNLYIMGGFDGTNYLMDVQYALINSDGTIGSTWRYATTLPQRIRQGDGFAANGYMYIFGGRSAATTCTSNTYVAPINANPIVNKVVQENPSALGEWSQTSVVFTGSRYGAAAAYNAGRAYLIGGVCNGVLTGANRVAYGTLQSQPQISRYSTMVDADGDVYPSKFLFNGIDSGIGARWLFNYRSSQQATNSWGQATDYGIVTLGTPGTYTARNGANVDTLSARYYYMRLTIDASQSFGYPEDSTRGPTIDDTTLQLSADPSKRLRNGKTFTGGQQQPLDTPF